MAQFQLIDNQLQTFVIKSRFPQWVLWPLVLSFGLAVLLGVEQYLHYYTMYQVIPARTIVDGFGVVRQSTDFTCVPAAMTTLLLHQGLEVEQREVTDRLGTTVFGTYPFRIPAVGKHYGFRVSKARLRFDELLASPDPLLLYNKFDEGLHVSYIPPGRLSPALTRELLEGRPGELLPVMDPVDGLVLMTFEGFVDYFDGEGAKTVYRFEPTATAVVAVDIEGLLLSGKLPFFKLGP